MKTQLKKLITSIHYLFLPAYIALIFATASAQKEKVSTIVEKPAIVNQLYHSWFFRKAITYFTTPYIIPYSKNSFTEISQ